MLVFSEVYHFALKPPKSSFHPFFFQVTQRKSSMRRGGDDFAGVYRLSSVDLFTFPEIFSIQIKIFKYFCGRKLGG